MRNCWKQVDSIYKTLRNKGYSPQDTIGYMTRHKVFAIPFKNKWMCSTQDFTHVKNVLHEAKKRG